MRRISARGGAVRGERVGRRRAGEPVERGALHRRREERLVRVLAVEVDEPGADLGELADGREPPVDVRPAAPVQRDDAREHDLVAGVGVDESAFDARLGGAVADERRVGASADEELERLDEQRLARAGLAGDRGEAATEHEREVGDDPEVGDVQLGQHRAEVRYRSARPNLAFRIWWKSRGPNVTMRAGRRAARARDGVARLERARARARRA